MVLAHFCTLALASVCGTGHHAHYNAPYVDDQTPHQCQTVARLRAQGYPQIIAGIPQGEPGNKCAGAVNALEWYPYWTDSLALPAPCGHKAYILQWNFAWTPSPPPTVKQRRRLLRQVEACKPAPSLIILY